MPACPRCPRSERLRERSLRSAPLCPAFRAREVAGLASGKLSTDRGASARRKNARKPEAGFPRYGGGGKHAGGGCGWLDGGSSTGNSNRSSNSYNRDNTTRKTVSTPLQHGYGTLHITLRGVRRRASIPAPEHSKSPRSPAVLSPAVCTDGGENRGKCFLALPLGHLLAAEFSIARPRGGFPTPGLHLTRAAILRNRFSLCGGPQGLFNFPARRPDPPRTRAHERTYLRECGQAPHRPGRRDTNLSRTASRPAPLRGFSRGGGKI